MVCTVLSVYLLLLDPAQLFVPMLNFPQVIYDFTYLEYTKHYVSIHDDIFVNTKKYRCRQHDEIVLNIATIKKTTENKFPLPSTNYKYFDIF